MNAINVLIVPSIATPSTNYHTSEVKKLLYLQGLKLAHPVSIHIGIVILFLIGADQYCRIVEHQFIWGCGLSTVKSKIGFLFSRPISQSSSIDIVSDHIYSVIATCIHTAIEQALEGFWDIENIWIINTITKNEPSEKVKV